MAWLACALASAVLLFAVGGEAALRLAGRYETWSEKNSGHYVSPYQAVSGGLPSHPAQGPIVFDEPEFHFQDRANAEGFRDKEFSLAKAPGEFRVLAIGDSCTEGQGADFSNTWPQHLERLLQKSCPRPVKVFNCGLAGGDPCTGYVTLKQRLLKYAPDLVILEINNSDVYDIIARGGMERFEKGFRPSSPLKWEGLYARSRLYRWYLHGVRGFHWLLFPKKELPKKVQTAMEKMSATVSLYRELSLRKGFAFAVAVHPWAYEVVQGRYADGFGKISGPIRAQGVCVMDLMGFFRKTMGADPRKVQDCFWPLDQHNKALGYRLLALGVFEGLEKNGLVPRDCAGRENMVKSL